MICAGRWYSLPASDGDSGSIEERSDMETIPTIIAIAVVPGLVIGTILAAVHINHLLILLHTARFKHEDAFLDFYDLFSSEEAFAIMQTDENAPGTYAEYLLMHQESRDRSWEAFKMYRKSLMRSVAVHYGIALVLLTVLLIILPIHTIADSLVYVISVFLLSVLLPHVLYVFERYFIRKHSRGFYLTALFKAVFYEALESKSGN